MGLPECMQWCKANAREGLEMGGVITYRFCTHATMFASHSGASFPLLKAEPVDSTGM